jgi:DMSO/TMAO reductase YedYZ molybdopterin-dependent catalytic subunit
MTVHETDRGPADRHSRRSEALPRGQRRVEGFPRFGTELWRPAPPVPADPAITVRGAVTEAFDVRLATLASLPRHELTADFHCVAGWSATGLRWEGVPFQGFYRAVIEPALEQGVEITHVVFRGLDRYRSVLLIEDATADGVLLADRLDGRPLDGDHGAPVRLVSPAQYGYMSTKHLCRIEVHVGEPKRERWTTRRVVAAPVAPEGEGRGGGTSRSGAGLAGAALLRGPQGTAARAHRPWTALPMRVPNAVHAGHPLRIHELAPDFILEDVWALPTVGGAGDFPTLLDVFANLDFPRSTSPPTRILWGIRDLLGRWFDLGRIDGTADSAARLPIPGTSETSLAARLPDDLRGTTDTDLGSPFTALYRTDDEYAAELSNRTVHAVLHLAWVEQGDGRFQGQMAVYVKPRGRFGQAYMTFIKPFRYLIVYPALMRHIERAWTERVPRQRGAVTG